MGTWLLLRSCQRIDSDSFGNLNGRPHSYFQTNFFGRRERYRDAARRAIQLRVPLNELAQGPGGTGLGSRIHGYLPLAQYSALGDGRSVDLAAQDRELVPQHDDLQVFGST